ncbi:uncharacterized protein Dana_GF27396 [Drosophila ananassae]|uniref:BPTI/Kunitz inhibitor domain-containing protein n=1 Tax=Drosophila ananassae TaxID=7217 RepID=A0A0P8XFC5_DROAN|nr:uncharacterized protein LOC26514805 [Drosophila ananassae]KPU73266.1 uncharacterized protein Dana_GF27396 [Drosophila ananassae]
MQLVTLFAFIILIGLALGQKDPVCVEEPTVDGLCPDIYSGYTYASARNICTRFRARACIISGNFFRTRDGCEAKCKVSTGSENGFMSFWSRSMSGFQDLMNSFSNFASK